MPLFSPLSPVDPRAADPRSRRRSWWIWSAVALTLLVAAGLTTLPPFVPPETRAWLMEGFRPFCHQLPERSFAVDGVPFAVCHRCFGIYAGLPAAAVLWLGLAAWGGWLSRHARWVLAAALVPMTADWGGDVLGLWTNTAASRVVTGGVFGLVAGLYLVRAVLQAARPVAAAREGA